MTSISPVCALGKYCGVLWRRLVSRVGIWTAQSLCEPQGFQNPMCDWEPQLYASDRTWRKDRDWDTRSYPSSELRASTFPLLLFWKEFLQSKSCSEQIVLITCPHFPITLLRESPGLAEVTLWLPIFPSVLLCRRGPSERSPLHWYFTWQDVPSWANSALWFQQNLPETFVYPA